MENQKLEVAPSSEFSDDYGISSDISFETQEVAVSNWLNWQQEDSTTLDAPFEVEEE